MTRHGASRPGRPQMSPLTEDTDGGDDEATVQAGEAVRRHGLLVHVREAVELALAALLGGLVVVRQAGTGVVQGVDERQGHGAGQTAGGDVGGHLLPVRLGLLHGEHALELILEGKVKRLGGEVAQHVRDVTAPAGKEAVLKPCISIPLTGTARLHSCFSTMTISRPGYMWNCPTNSPQRVETLIGDGALKAVANTAIRLVKAALLDHLILHLPVHRFGVKLSGF